MNRKAAWILGLIGGILVTASVFTTWYTSPLGDTSGWDLAKDADMMAPYLLLVAGIIVILTSLLLVVKPQEIMEALMGTFTVLSAASAVGVIMNEGATDLGYGAYVLLIGAILALISLLVKKPEK